MTIMFLFLLFAIGRERNSKQNVYIIVFIQMRS